MPERSIIHLDLDTFFVSVERLRNSKLNDIPVIVGGYSDRGVVSACSYEARKYGVRSAMPMRTARLLCPDAIVLRGDHDAYSKYSGMVTEIISEDTPMMEKASIDEFYIDMTGMDRYFGSFKLAGQIKERVKKETGLTVSFGLSGNKTVSKMATNEAKPNGQLHIPYGNEKQFIAPMAVNKIPMVGKNTSKTLRNLGIYTVKSLSEMPVRLMESIMGKHGIALWERANGIDSSPVVPYRDQKSISKETTFDSDTTDTLYMRSTLIRMVEQLGLELRNQHFLTSCVTVKIRYSDFDTHTMQKQILFSAADHVLIKSVLELFDKLYNRRLLIRLIGVRFSKLARGYNQLNVFDDSATLYPLYTAMDRIRNKYGNHAVKRSVAAAAQRRFT